MDKQKIAIVLVTIAVIVLVAGFGTGFFFSLSLVPASQLPSDKDAWTEGSLNFTVNGRSCGWVASDATMSFTGFESSVYQPKVGSKCLDTLWATGSTSCYVHVVPFNSNSLGDFSTYTEFDCYVRIPSTTVGGLPTVSLVFVYGSSQITIDRVYTDAWIKVTVDLTTSTFSNAGATQLSGFGLVLARSSSVSVRGEWQIDGVYFYASSYHVNPVSPEILAVNPANGQLVPNDSPTVAFTCVTYAPEPSDTVISVQLSLDNSGTYSMVNNSPLATIRTWIFIMNMISRTEHTYKYVATDSLGLTVTETGSFTVIDPSIPRYSLTVLDSIENGTVSITVGEHWFYQGDSVSVLATAANGYSFDHWNVDNSNSTANPLALIINQNHVLQAVFIQTSSYPNLQEWLMTGENWLIVVIVGVLLVSGVAYASKHRSKAKNH